jgi:hypothetical protein
LRSELKGATTEERGELDEDDCTKVESKIGR